MTGIPINDAETTEGFLLDFRRTMTECVADNFYGTVKGLCKQNGLPLLSETLSPVMISDDMLHHKYVDSPGGEFWVRAWQNWKPLDINGAVSAARVYGKNVVFTESFTGGGWQDHPYSESAPHEAATAGRAWELRGRVRERWIW